MLSTTKIRLKRATSLTIFLIMLTLTVSACKTAEIQYKPGSYINEAEGYYSTLIVKVTVDESRILDIEIVSHEEPELLSDIVFKRLPPMMKKKNTHDVDVISGATYTSRALIEAVGKALEQAKEAQ
mgnify:CR=1 FL=1